MADSVDILLVQDELMTESLPVHKVNASQQQAGDTTMTEQENLEQINVDDKTMNEQQLLPLDQANKADDDNVIVLSDDDDDEIVVLNVIQPSKKDDKIVALNKTGPTPSKEDDEIVVLNDTEPTLSKRAKLSGNFGNSPMQSSNTPIVQGNSPEVNHSALMDCLDQDLKRTIQMRLNLDQKVIDILIGMVSKQFRESPTIIRQFITEQRVVLPNAFFRPPSQAVDLIVENDPPFKIPQILDQMFSKQRLKLNLVEKYKQQSFQINFPAPALTQVLFSIGQDLVQEYVYSDTINGRDMPKKKVNIKQKKKTTDELKPLLSQLREKNKSFHFKMEKCNICGFETESEIAMSIHAQTLHFCKDKMLKCGICPEFNTNGFLMHRHYVEAHGLKPLIPEEPPAKIQCSLCKLNFQTKTKLNAHIKTCKKEKERLSSIQRPRIPTDLAIVNQWLWQRPTFDPTAQLHRQQMK